MSNGTVKIGDVFRNINKIRATWRVIAPKMDRLTNRQLEDRFLLECMEYGAPRESYSARHLLKCERVTS